MKRKWLRVSTELVCCFLSGLSSKHSLIVEGMPKDARIVDVLWYPTFATIKLLVESDTFEPVTSCEYPDLEVRFIVTKEAKRIFLCG